MGLGKARWRGLGRAPSLLTVRSVPCATRACLPCRAAVVLEVAPAGFGLQNTRTHECSVKKTWAVVVEVLGKQCDGLPSPSSRCSWRTLVRGRRRIYTASDEFDPRAMEQTIPDAIRTSNSGRFRGGRMPATFQTNQPYPHVQTRSGFVPSVDLRPGNRIWHEPGVVSETVMDVDSETSDSSRTSTEIGFVNNKAPIHAAPPTLAVNGVRIRSVRPSSTTTASADGS